MCLSDQGIALCFQDIQNHFDLSILLVFFNILIDVTWNEVNFDLPLCPFSVFM